MDFTNMQIPVAGLPQVEEITFQPLEKEYLVVERISYTITTIVIFLIGFAIFYFIEETQNYKVILSVAALFTLFTVVGWITTVVGFRVSGYAIRDKDVLYRSGWLVRKTRIVPLNRIQHVSVQSGPIERKYKLGSVSIFTAGAGQADFTIRGIKEATAHQLKDWLTTQLNGNTTT